MRRLVWIVVAAGVVLVAFAALRAQVTQPGPTYQLWEYRTEIVRGPLSQDPSEGMMNTLGREGWELAGFSRREVRIQDAMHTETLYVFKRSRSDARR